MYTVYILSYLDIYTYIIHIEIVMDICIHIYTFIYIYMDLNGDFCSGCFFFQRLYNQDQGKDLAIMASRPSCSDRSGPVQQIGVETCEQFGILEQKILHHQTMGETL